MIVTRPATPADLPLLREMLAAAVTWSGEPVDEVALADPRVRHYVAGWPGPGDLGVVAVDVGHGPLDRATEVGAAWLRHLTAADAGYGYVRDGVPELAMGVRAGHRGRGIGTRLVAELLPAARRAGIPAVSLSVEDGNDAARRLYVRSGFTVVGRSGSSDVMLADLRA